MSSETESSGVWFIADNLGSGPKLFSLTHKIILLLVTRYPQSSLLSIHSVTKGPPLACLCGKSTRTIPKVPETSPNGTGWDPLDTNLKPERRGCGTLQVSRTYYYRVKCPWGTGKAFHEPELKWASFMLENRPLHVAPAFILSSPKKESENLQSHRGELANAYNSARQEVCSGSL